LHLVGFITKKFVTMHGHMNVKLHLPSKISWTNPFHHTSSFRILYFSLISLCADCFFLQSLDVHSNYFQLQISNRCGTSQKWQY